MPAPAFFPRGFAAWSFFSRLRPAARTLPRRRCSPSHSGQPLSPVSMCCAWAAPSEPAPRRSAPRMTRACTCLLDLRVRGAFLRACLRLETSRGRVVLRRTPGNLFPPFPCVQSDPALRRPYPVRHALAPAFVTRLFAAQSFPSCLRLAARNLPRPLRSSSHSRQPFSHVPMCCAWAARSNPVPRLTAPKHITRTRACLLVLQVRDVRVFWRK